MRGRACYARKRRTGAVQSAASTGPVPSNAAKEVQWSYVILSVQFVRGVGLSRSVPSGDGLEEGSNRHVGRGRVEGRSLTRLSRTQFPRILRKRGEAV